MTTEQYPAPHSSEKSIEREEDKNKQINNLIQEFADIGVVDIAVIPAEEFTSAFSTKFENEDEQDFLSDTRKRFDQPMYSEDGSEVVAYQVYAYTDIDISSMPEEQRKKFDELNERAIELGSN